MNLRRSLLLPALPLLLPLAACDDPSGPESVIELGFVGEPYELRIDAGVVGDDVVVQVITYGNACVSHHHTDVDVDESARTIVVRPYNEREIGTCQDILLEIDHVVTVEPRVGGDWTVLVIGAVGYAGSGQITDEFEVQVSYPLNRDWKWRYDGLNPLPAEAS